MATELEVSLKQLTVAIVEDQPPTLRGLVGCLEQLGCCVMWTAKDHEEAKAAAARNLPEIMFVDLRLPDYETDLPDYESGWQLVRYMIGRDRNISIIIYSGYPVVSTIALEAIRLGCSYIVKEDLVNNEQEIIASALLAASTKSVFLSRQVANVIPVIIDRLKGPDVLSPRELEVLELVADGLETEEIAKKMVLAESTIKSHISHILVKLNVNTRGKAAEWYRQQYGS